MKYFFSLILFFILIISCKEKVKTNNIKPDISIQALQFDFMKWWDYYNSNIKLSSTFVSIDENSKIISKQLFLKALKTGKYIPIQLKGNNSNTVKQYQLFELASNFDKNIKSTIQMEASNAYKHFQLEGTLFPNFSFKDLEGKSYSSEVTKGKILVLKCWFIQCQKCIEEFPVLNNLVKKYNNRNDILFVSLASDTKKELQEFLSKKSFTYKVIAEQADFMKEKLGLTMYPTHYIIDENGIIKKVVNSVDELQQELSVFINKKKRPSPPPPSQSK